MFQDTERSLTFSPAIKTSSETSLSGAVLVLIQFDVCEEIKLDELSKIIGAPTLTQPSFKHPTPGYVRYQRPPVVEPLDPLVLFFHHPFELVIFRQVRDRIERSLAQYPREILIIYYDPKCGAVFEESPYFRVVKRGVSESGSAWAGDWVVYETCSAPADRRQKNGV